MNQAILEEQNNDFLKRKKDNPAKVNHFVNKINNTGAKALSDIKNFPKTVKVDSDNSYFKIFNKVGIPERYKRAKLSDFTFTDTKLLKYFKLLKKAVEMGRGLIICGDYETGKTHFAFALAKEILKTFATEDKEKSISLKFVEFEDFLTDIRIRDNGEVMSSYFSAKVLIIDDFFSKNIEDWELSKLTNVVSKRYNAKKSIIFTANIKPSEIAEKVGGRFWQRIKKVTHPVEFLADSFKGCREKYDSKEWDDLT